MSGAGFFFMALAQSLLPWGSLRASQLLLQAPPPTLAHPVLSGWLILLPHSLENSASGLAPVTEPR